MDPWVSGECPDCGGYMLRQNCWQCHGAGEFDLHEDNPIEYEPGEREVCTACYGAGTHSWCPECVRARNEQREALREMAVSDE